MTEPLISIRLLHSHQPVFEPGEELVCEYQVDAVESDDVMAVEESVLWYTEGKGDEDLAVHHFHRRTPQEFPDQDLRALREMRCVVPYSPLSYEGVILKIRWCVRVRVFLKKGRETHLDQPFQLGHVPPPPRPQPTIAKPDEDDE